MNHYKKEEPDNLLTLQTIDGRTLCVCTSFEKLAEAVDYWMQQEPDATMVWYEWKPDYFYEASTWEWAYVSPNESEEKLSGGEWVPQKEIRGVNLVNIDLAPHADKWHQDWWDKTHEEH